MRAPQDPLRTCRDCGQTYPLAEFNVAGTANKNRYRCRECQRARDRKHTANYFARHTEQERERLARLRRTPKAEVRDLLRRAVKDGRVVKPEACEACGLVRPLAGHHADYDRPFDVQWLCRLCHEALHRRLRQEKVA